MSGQFENAFEMETQTIHPVPDSERKGKKSELFGIWFGIQMIPLCVATGAISTTELGLPFWWALVALILGHVVGGVAMGLHAAQGPQLGVPQMLQGRGQFGLKGSVLVVILSFVMFVGFFVFNIILAGDALQHANIGASPTLGTWLGAIASFLIVMFGYGLVRFSTALTTYVVGFAAIVSFLWIIFAPGVSVDLHGGDLTAVGFFSTLAIAAVWQVAFAPYVSDYSRYMPKETGGVGAFWGTYGGAVSGALLMMILGALIGVSGSESGEGAMGTLYSILGPVLGAVILFVFFLGAAVSNSVNTYCSVLTALTTVETFRSGWNPGTTARLVTTVLVHALGLLLALIIMSGGAESFANYYGFFITLLLYVLIPWSAINLVDFYIIKKGDYDIESFYKHDGGIYGKYNKKALWIYAVGVVVQIPFIVTFIYTGPIAEWLGGVDVAWIVGLILSSAIYYVAERRSGRTPAVQP